MSEYEERKVEIRVGGKGNYLIVPFTLKIDSRSCFIRRQGAEGSSGGLRVKEDGKERKPKRERRRREGKKE